MGACSTGTVLVNENVFFSIIVVIIYDSENIKLNLKLEIVEMGRCIIKALYDRNCRIRVSAHDVRDVAKKPMRS